MKDLIGASATGVIFSISLPMSFFTVKEMAPERSYSLLRELLTMDARYAVVLMEIKERGVASIEKERRITLIVAEFHVKLSVCSHVRSFLLIKFSFNFKIVVFVFRVRYDSEKII
jgi:hypothetical protein